MAAHFQCIHVLNVCDIHTMYQVSHMHLIGMFEHRSSVQQVVGFVQVAT